ncbi:MAG: hypothetical protein RIK87_03180 [Fuerstiella sp.]
MAQRHTSAFYASILLLLTGISGCQTTTTGLVSCGESCTGEVAQDTLVIFIGADRDVGKWGRLPEVAADFRCRGFNAVYFDPWKQWHDDELLADWIRKAVRCRGQRVMLVGWSYGTVVGLKAAEIVRREGICIDTLVDLDCFGLNWHMGDDIHPSNVGRVVVIHSGLNRRVPEGYRCPSVHFLDTCWHLNAPTDPHTTRVLLSEACRLQSWNQPQPTTVPMSNLSAAPPIEQLPEAPTSIDTLPQP